MSRIIGQNIILREYHTDDLELMHSWNNNADITNNLDENFYSPQTLRKTEEFVNFYTDKNNHDYFFIIADKKSNKYIGQIDFLTINWIHKNAELAIIIGDSKNHGKGIGKEATNLFLDFGFNKLNLHRIYLRVHDYNEAAIKCYKSCGFIEEGKLRNAYYINNSYTDWILMSILKEEFN